MTAPAIDSQGRFLDLEHHDEAGLEPEYFLLLVLAPKSTAVRQLFAATPLLRSGKKYFYDVYMTLDNLIKVHLLCLL